jgi:hypothetical protein
LASGDRTQRRRFIEAARKHGVSEDEAVIRENLKRIAKTRPSSGDEKKEQGDAGAKAHKR